MNDNIHDCLRAYYLLMKAEQDDTETLLTELGYWSPKYLASQISRAFDIKLGFIDETIDAVQEMVREFEKNWTPPIAIPTEGIYTTQLAKADWNSLNEEQQEAFRLELLNYLDDPINKQAMIANGLEKQYKTLRDQVYASTTMTIAKHTLEVFNPTTPLGNLWKKYSMSYMNTVGDHAFDMAVKMKVTDVESVINALSKGMSEGNGVHSVIKNLKDNPEFSVARARTFAITETLTAYSQGQNMGIMDSDVVTHKEWMHTGSKGIKPRPHHVAMDGLIIPKDEKFDVDGYDADFPRDPNLPPKERINCHCAINPSMGEDDGWGDVDEYLDKAREEIDKNGGYTFEDGMTFEDLEDEIFGKSQYAKDHPDEVPPSKRKTQSASSLLTATDESRTQRAINDGSLSSTISGVNRGDRIYLDSLNPDNDHSLLTTDMSKAIDSLLGAKEVKNNAYSYSSSAYRPVNEYLRGQEVESWQKEAVANVIQSLQEGINSSTLPYNTVAYRGVKPSLDTSHYKAGDYFIDPAFMSVTLSRKIAESFAGIAEYNSNISTLFRLYLPEGYNALSMYPYSGFNMELELLLNPSSQFKITGIEVNGNVRYIDLEPII